MSELQRQIVALNLAGDVRLDEPLLQHTTYEVGGPAEAWVEPGDVESLSRLLQFATAQSIPWVIIGAGSNVLVSDAGIGGIVIHLAGAFRQLRIEREGLGPKRHALVAGAGTMLETVVNEATREGLGDVTFLAGIPGTVGGAVRMNAGTHQGEMRDILHQVLLVGADGNMERFEAEHLVFNYRGCELPHNAIVAEATLLLQDVDPQQARGEMDSALARRAARQPHGAACCGSVFRNPAGDHAGRLIEAAGLKGESVGGAVVSSKHANFIVNEGGASATDIWHLIQICQARVQQQFDILLETEVIRLGKWE